MSVGFREGIKLLFTFQENKSITTKSSEKELILEIRISESSICIIFWSCNAAQSQNATLQKLFCNFLNEFVWAWKNKGTLKLKDISFKAFFLYFMLFICWVRPVFLMKERELFHSCHFTSLFFRDDLHCMHVFVMYSK